jgi:3-hydroxyacyl-CoA dehydrogenase/enoyl-CoA hydratase/3-hydroxybutyryl-CoA epimerase
MHFFNPPNKMPLVEVVSGEKTSPEAIATAVDISRKLGKMPIVVRDCPGFLVNRIFVIGANEIMRMYEEGLSYDRLEKIMLDFGMPMSPFILADEVGNDVGYKVSKAHFEAYGSRMAVPVIVEAMYAHELWGKKNGQGFYLYKGDKKKPNPKVAKLRKEIGNANKEASIQLSDQDVLNRALLPMINEAARCLQEQVVSKPEYLDMAMIMGTGFPPFRGGLLRYADSLGIAYVDEHLKAFQKRYGERFEPCALIGQMQRDEGKFYTSKRTR